MIINVLVNSPRGSVFLESHDASNSSTDGSKMYNLFRKTIDKIGKENIVQIVTDNASENVSAGRMMEAMYPHIYWTPCAAHCTNLMFGDIFKENPYASGNFNIVIYTYGERKPPMGYLYEAMDRAKETIAASFEGDVRKYEKVFEIIDIRDENLASEVWIGYHACLEKLVHNSVTIDQIGEEFGRYSQAEGLFGLQAAIRARDIRSPVEWWKQFGHQTPNLQKFAIKVLSLTCSASGCERNWSVFEHIHSKKRNRLELSRLNDLVYIKYNRTLRRRYEAHDTIDPILLDNIDESNEWLTGAPQNHEDEQVYEGDDLDWGTVSMAVGVEENIYGLRGSSSSYKGKGVASSSRSLIDENSENEEDDSQYNANIHEVVEFENLEEE
ncbi:uncharacterized protein [Nicotiana tomentosiformis]|uniref:uncharacterized protein n=1 Tax=Nicotiana tomentosiformis TaxID=4098 RepID=UPI00388CE1E6